MMCAFIYDHDDPRFGCDCHLWRDEEQESHEPDEDESPAMRRWKGDL